MARGNGPVVTATIIRLPPELIAISKLYQNNRRLPSFSAALKELLETHPALLAIMVRPGYDNSNQQDYPERAGIE